MTKDEALKLALEALDSSSKLINGHGTKFGLEGAMDGYYRGCFDVDGNNKLLNEAITAIKEALAQPAQEPVAWAVVGEGKFGPYEIGLETETNPRVCKYWANRGYSLAPLYTTPPQRPWVGLTVEDCKGMSAGDKVVALWAEAALRNKNT